MNVQKEMVYFLGWVTVVKYGQVQNAHDVYV